MYTCPRCNGTGYLKEYGHVRNGVCFKCSGSGKVSSKPKRRKVKRDPSIAEENKRKMAAAIEMYKDDDRAGVPYGNAYFYMHAIELAKLDGIWETL